MPSARLPLPAATKAVATTDGEVTAKQPPPAGPLVQRAAAAVDRIRVDFPDMLGAVKRIMEVTYTSVMIDHIIVEGAKLILGFFFIF